MNSVRRAAIDDSERISVIHVDGWREAYRNIVPSDYLNSLKPEHKVSLWKRFISQGGGSVLVAESNETVAGFCHVIKSRDQGAEYTAEIAAVYVDPTQWRKGLGRALCLEALAYSTDQGFKWLTLWVLTNNAQGRRFYESMGFMCDGAVKTEMLGSVNLQETRYRIALEEPEQPSSAGTSPIFGALL